MELEKKVIAATLDVFDTMVMLETVPEAPLDRGAAISCNISGMLGLAGDLRGMLTVHCPGNLAKEITARLLGEDDDVSEEDVRDAIAEIVNMIAGGIKTAFITEGKMLELSVPTTVSGNSYSVRSAWNATHIIIPFRVGEERLWTELKFLETAD
jgi:chemotaxis protein CheX